MLNQLACQVCDAQCRYYDTSTKKNVEKSVCVVLSTPHCNPPNGQESLSQQVLLMREHAPPFQEIQKLSESIDCPLSIQTQKQKKYEHNITYLVFLFQCGILNRFGLGNWQILFPRDQEPFLAVSSWEH